jgi:hypothetical protein
MGNPPQVEETKEKELIMEQIESYSVKFADIPLISKRLSSCSISCES